MTAISTASGAPSGEAASSPAERMRALALELAAHDAWSRDELLAHQDARLRALLRHAVARSAYYREALGPDADERPLSELPTLSKPTLMREWDRIACDARIRLAPVNAHAASPDADVPFRGEFQVFSTSGASGVRGVFAYDAAAWAESIGFTLRALIRMGAAPDTRIVGIGAPGGVHMSKRIFAVFQAGRPDAPRLSVLTPLEEAVDGLNAFQPEIVFGYPSHVGRLAAEQRAGRLRIAPRFVGLGSEPVAEDVRALAREAWGLECGEYYAATELPLIAGSGASHPRVLELNEDLAVIEVVDEANRGVAPGTPGAKLLITNLANRALPLIRYELTDRVTVSPEPNPTGRPYAHVAGVDGRAADVLTFPGRSGKEVEVVPLRFSAAFARLTVIGAHQVVLHPDALELRVVLEPGATPDAPETIAAAVRAALADAGAVPPTITVTPVAELEREPGHAAKLKLVVDRRDVR